MQRNSTSFSTSVLSFLRRAYAEYARATGPGGEPPKDPAERREWQAARLLRYYQFLTRAVMVSPLVGIAGSTLIASEYGSRGLLVYYPMGMGKTDLAASIAMGLWDRFRPIVLAPRGLHRNFDDTVRRASARLDGPQASPERQARAAARFRYVSSDAHNAAMQLVRRASSLEGALLIVDEAHNFFRSIVNSASEDTNARQLYGMVMAASNIRIVFLTGTPASKNPFELVPCFNMLAGHDLLPTHYDVFVRTFVDAEASRMKNRAQFLNRIAGMVSHAGYDLPARLEREASDGAPAPASATVSPFPEKLPLIIEEVEMSPDQYNLYLLAREREGNEGGRGGGRGPGGRGGMSSGPALALPGAEREGGSTYYVRSRTLGNFAPPRLKSPPAGERPESGMPLEPTAVSRLDPDTLPDSAFTPAASPKITLMLERIATSPGPVIVYSQFVGMGGLKVVARYMRLAGYLPWQAAAGGGEGPAEPMAAGAAEAAAETAAAGAAEVAARLASACNYTAQEARAIAEFRAQVYAAPPPVDGVVPMAGSAPVPFPYRAHGPGSVHRGFNLHRGQRKLFLGELNCLLRLLPDPGAKARIVYAGAAPGLHLPQLLELFPGTTWDLYDPAGFAALRRRLPRSQAARVRTTAGLFTDDIARGLRGRCDIFISDIRVGDVNREETAPQDKWSRAFEAQVGADMAMQQAWVELAAPALGSMLKFRPPYADPGTGAALVGAERRLRYLRGACYWQSWPPGSSTETRLVSTRADLEAGPVDYDLLRYQDLCTAHNVMHRPWGVFTYGGREPAPAPRVPGYDGCFDCAWEAQLWYDYEVAAGRRPRASAVARHMTRLTELLHQGLCKAGLTHGLHSGRGTAGQLAADPAARHPCAAGLAPPAPPAPPAAPAAPTAVGGGARRYALLIGETPEKERKAIQEAWNSPANAHGDVIFALLFSKTGAEGLDLKYGRQGHVLEPYWDKAREDQVFHRIIRPGSHQDLPPEERTVQPYLYIAVANQEVLAGIPRESRENATGETIDMRFHLRAEARHRLNLDFRAALREASLECALYGAAGARCGACRLCRPTGAQLFHPDLERDLRLPDPCVPLEENEVEARPLPGPGGYYFTKNEGGLGVQFYRFDPGLDAYVEVEPSAPEFAELEGRLREAEANPTGSGGS